MRYGIKQKDPCRVLRVSVTSAAMIKLLKWIVIVTVLLCAVFQLTYLAIEVDEPTISDSQRAFAPTLITNGQFTASGNSWYGQNNFNLWECYLEGSPYEAGRTFGVLAEKQIVEQEVHFVAQIQRMIPSTWFLKTLKFGVAGFNRNIDSHIPEEFQHELFGVSRSFADEFDFIGPKFSRIMNYHAAHDIGHALQDLSIVGCSSFARWDSTDFIVARNFDFYMGEDFAKDKIILFRKPDEGIPFASITWAGFMGVVSGMNLEGLTVSLNASKSSVPTGAKTPISILAREILQYASTIDEAIAIAESRSTFVSESILIGSANDNRAVVIEKGPDQMDVYDPNNGQLICTNHYQSDTFENTEVNKQNIEMSDSYYRFQRLWELLDKTDSLTVDGAAGILRNRKGLNDAELGHGNPKALNQLLAHHGIVFQPRQKQLFISTAPYQMGAFLCYDLEEVFADPTASFQHIDSLQIASDPFVDNEVFKRFDNFKYLKNELLDYVIFGRKIDWNSSKERELIGSNPESYVTYMLLGDYYAGLGNCVKAIEYYQTSLTKEVASRSEFLKIEDAINACNE